MALIVRAEADRVALAEKLIQDLDKPKAEVLIDVMVMSHTMDNSHNLGDVASRTALIRRSLITAGERRTNQNATDLGYRDHGYDNHDRDHDGAPHRSSTTTGNHNPGRHAEPASP